MLRHSNSLYIRSIREIDMAVLGVGEDGQKSFYDPISGKRVPYITGQQGKFGIVEKILQTLGASPAEMIIVHRPDKDGKFKEGEIYFEDPDPSHPEIWARGHMKNVKRQKSKDGTKTKKSKKTSGESSEEDSEEQDTTIIKRRSFMSSSSMVPLNSRVIELSKSRGSVCVDRSSSAQFHKLMLDENGRNILFDDVQDEDIRNRMKPRKYNGSEKSMIHGIMVHDLALDMDRIFAISCQKVEPEVSPKVLERLRSSGWVNIFHPQIGDMVYLPKEFQAALTESLAEAIVSWRVTSNQSQHFTLMNTLAMTVSTNANEVKSCVIPVFTKNDFDKDVLVNFDIEETKDSKVFVSKSIKILTPEYNGACSINAMDMAREFIIDKISSYEMRK